jgi:hypothetical protein
MFKPAFILFIASLFFLAFATIAQSPSATITGLVLDSSGAVIVGAEVIVVSDATGVHYSSKTNADGIYVVTNVAPGLYRLQVSRIGFKTLIKPDITLNVQDAVSINFTLPVGAVSEVVTVEGGAPLINVTNGSVGAVVDHNFVENMPLNGRSFQDLILLTPGVVANGPQTPAAVGVSGEFSVNGQRTESNYYTVDGVSANGGIFPRDPSYLGNSGSLPAVTALGTTQGLVSVDALQEFRVQSSSYTAEFGRNPGGQFSFVTRSGTNQWHGTAFDFLRNDVFDANDWFNDYYRQAKPAERQNDFGGTFGGPVRIPRFYDGKGKPGKTFVFFSYEGLRLVQPQAANTTYVPDSYLRTCTPVALAQVLNAFPQPRSSTPPPDCTNPDPGNGLAPFIGVWSNPSSLDATSVRFDRAVGEKVKLFFRFSGTSSGSAARDTRAASQVDNTGFTTRTYTFGATGTLTNRMSSEFRLNYSSNAGTSTARLDGIGGADAANLARLQGIDTSANPDYQMSFLFFFGHQPQLLEFAQRSLQRQWNVVDTVNLAIGRHQLKFGGDFRRLAPVLRQESPHVYYYYFRNTAVLANNASGAYVQGTGSAYPVYLNLSAFVQDEWRLTPRLVVSTGVRWEVNPAPGVTRGVKPYTIAGTSDLATMTLAPQGTPLWQTSWYNFAPRLGAAYILKNIPGFESIVRGGVGIFYDTAQQAGSQGFAGPGYGGYFFAAGQLSFPLSALAVPPPVVNPPAPRYFGAVGYATNLQLPYTWETNLTFEQALGNKQALTVSYVGHFGRKLLELSQINVQPLNPNFSTVQFFRNGLSSDYNAAQIQFHRRLSRGLQVLGSYTWSHCLDYGSSNFAYPYVRGNCDYDLRQNFSSAVSYEVPNRFRSRLARVLLDHWSIDDRFSAHTALPITLNGNGFFDPVSAQFQYSGLDLVPGQPIYAYGSQCAAIYGVSCPGGRAINVNAFTLPAAGQYGNAPRNFARGFAAWQMDLAFRREIPIKERLKLQFRAEAFNVFNHPNFGFVDPYYFPGSPTFGLATSTLARSLGGLSSLYQAGGPRSLQFALKLIF